MLAFACVCFMSRRLQKPRDIHEELEEHGQNVNSIAERTLFMLRAERPLGIEISDKQLEMGVSSLKVRASKLSLSPAIERLTCSPACHHVSRVSPGHPTLMGTFMATFCPSVVHAG